MGKHPLHEWETAHGFCPDAQFPSSPPGKGCREVDIRVEGVQVHESERQPFAREDASQDFVPLVGEIHDI